MSVLSILLSRSCSLLEVLQVIEEAVSAGRFTPRDFCIYCMVRRPVRAKHCKVCSKCVARHDHHCPWIWNCVGVDNHRQFFLFTTTLVIGVCLFDRLALACARAFPDAPRILLTRSCPDWSQLPTPSETSRELTCVFPQAICDASHADTFTFAIACWATLQLSWTVLVAASHAYQITRQLTTYELSNLGRFGYMGGRASNLNQQQQSDTGGCPREGGHHHRHNGAKVFKRLLALLGLDLYTKGKAAEGIRKSATERRSDKFNPFDAGIWRNCTDFWSRGKTLGVDYVSVCLV